MAARAFTAWTLSLRPASENKVGLFSRERINGLSHSFFPGNDLLIHEDFLMTQPPLV